MNWRPLVSALALLAASGHTLSCSPVPDNRSWEQRLNAAPLVFVGRVSSVQGRKALFEVENALRGTKAATLSIDLPPPRRARSPSRQARGGYLLEPWPMSLL